MPTTKYTRFLPGRSNWPGAIKPRGEASFHDPNQHSASWRSSIFNRKLLSPSERFRRGITILGFRP